jgi:hypothetical protein
VRIYLRDITIGVDGRATSYSHADLKKIRAALHGNEFAIYVLRDDRGILYVGESRLGSFRAMRGFKVGYSQTTAYKWRRDADLRSKQLQCLVFCYLSPVSFFGAQRARRCLEAELTFELRSRGAWPRKMTEIHFYESLRQQPEVQDMLSLILTELRTRAWIPESK